MHATWQEFLTIVREEVGSRVVETWFKAIVFERWDSVENSVYLTAPNAFVRDWIQKNYIPLLQMHLGRLLHVEKPRIIIESTNFAPSPIQAQDTQALQEEIRATRNSSDRPRTVSVMPATMAASKNGLVIVDRPKYGHINKGYLFENFIVGPHNSLAYAAAYAVTEQPGQRYNPLFIYGKSGLGKTHLMHAIGNEIKARYKDVSVLYQTADRFVSEFISAIRFNKVHSFQEKYHTVDVLLIDDLQFISNKEHTQEAFFHIFNALYESRKQIVFSSDTFPHDIQGIAERLRSRLASGLVADIHVPSLETKIAIVKKKASINDELLDDEVAQFIALQAPCNIRELEGALIRVLAFASLTKQEVTIDLARKVLQRVQYSKPQQMVDFERIVNCLSKHYPYTLQDLRSKHRSKELSEVRHIAIFLMKKLTDKSFRDIGSFLGGRDHSTIMHGMQKVEEYIQQNSALQVKIQLLEREIAG